MAGTVTRNTTDEFAPGGHLGAMMVPTTCSFPQAYLTLTVDSEGTMVRFHPLAGPDGIRHAYSERSTDSATSRRLTAMAPDRLSRFPLVDKRP